MYNSKLSYLTTPSLYSKDVLFDLSQSLNKSWKTMLHEKNNESKIERAKIKKLTWILILSLRITGTAGTTGTGGFGATTWGISGDVVFWGQKKVSPRQNT